MIVLLSGSANTDLTGLSPWEQNVLNMKQGSAVTYTYSTPEALRFELHARTAIVEAAKGLYRSGASFAEFKNSRCSPLYWSRTRLGGFQLQPGVLPSDAVEDIFRNGRLYAFECAAAIVLVMYKAILDVVGRPVFNTYFQDLVLFTWYLDNDLRFKRVQLPDVYPGDSLYFNNPDFVPFRPGWRGENTILLEPDLFFAHGPGILSSGAILALLNSKRIPGSTTPAHILNDALCLDFEHIRRLKEGTARIGRRKFISG
ncbi:protein-glutamine gamma-glutamyltransferase [Paenibacillus pinistramenti]|uniref:protein-glutamine gamma-glutamyltransferase n=1 Tax=Paenibacillus pinistramenti TaxID=1768003 RepID=UPI001109C957|nr:protein-glutamine gamma-glutamyltransferase [Paenibacillus pinistramenti]